MGRRITIGRNRAPMEQSASPEPVVKSGTFCYDGLRLCKVRIVQTDFRPGSGDHEDSEEWREDHVGTLFRIDYTPPHCDRFSAGGGYCPSFEDAVKSVERSVQGVLWDQ